MAMQSGCTLLSIHLSSSKVPRVECTSAKGVSCLLHKALSGGDSSPQCALVRLVRRLANSTKLRQERHCTQAMLAMSQRITFFRFFIRVLLLSVHVGLWVIFVTALWQHPERTMEARISS